MSHPKLGPTGQFPHGKISTDDNGELVIGIDYDETSDCIIIHFGVKVEWIGMERKEAMALAESIMEQAQSSPKERKNQ